MAWSGQPPERPSEREARSGECGRCHRRARDSCTTATRPIHQLYDYLDGELTEERRTEIAEHLDYCGPCAGLRAFEAELRQVIADRCKDHVPDSLRQRIAELIEAERASRRMSAAASVSRRRADGEDERRDRPTQPIVDWAIADRVARWAAGRTAVPASYRPAAMQRDFDELTARAEALVAEATGLAVASPARGG